MVWLAFLPLLVVAALVAALLVIDMVDPEPRMGDVPWSDAE